MKNTFIILGFVLNSIIMVGQTQSDPEAELILLYEKALTKWKTSSEVETLISNNPELKAVVDNIKMNGINANRTNIKMHFLSLIDGDLKDQQIEFIKELFDPENINLIEGVYWKIVNSNEAKEIGELVVDYMFRVKGDLERKINNFPIKN